MAFFSTGLRAEMMNGSGALNALDGGKLIIYTQVTDPLDPIGSRVPIPQSADAEAVGRVLMELTDNGSGAGLQLEAQGDFIKNKSGHPWACNNVLHSGEMNYFRLVAAGDTGAESITEPRIQGTISRSQGDMLVQNLQVVQGSNWTLNTFMVSLAVRND